MTNRLFSVFLAAAAICVVPLAAQAQAPREACLQVGRIDSLSPIKGSNERAMVVTDKTFKKFKVSFITPCQGIDFNMGVGASLSWTKPADVVLTAVAGFADAGNEKNKDNAYLGDMAYSAGEPAGDVPVVTASSYGDGRVLVFGDTSPFQNGSLGQADRFLTDCLRWLLRKEPERGPLLPWARAALALAAVALTR